MRPKASFSVSTLTAAYLAAMPLVAPLSAFGVGVLCTGCGDDEAESSQPTDEPGEGAELARVHGLDEEQAGQLLARVGETEITLGQFAEEMASKGSFVRARYNSPERRREFLDQMIRFELLAQEASAQGHDQAPEVQRARKQMMIRHFLEQHFDQGGPTTVSAEDISGYYEAHPQEFHTPAQVRASHIQLNSRNAATRILQQLQAAPTDLRLFRRLAQEHNADTETRDRFGDLRFFSRPGERGATPAVVPDPVAEAAFSIEQIGGIASEVVQSGNTFHIVKLTGRRAAMHRSLEEAERPIRNRLWREHREARIEALLQELRDEADVQENLELLQQVHPDLPEEGEMPRAAPNSPHGQGAGPSRMGGAPHGLPRQPSHAQPSEADSPSARPSIQPRPPRPVPPAATGNAP